MTIITIKSVIRFAAVFAIALAATAANSGKASAAGSCPGGGTQKCTFKCTGPVTAPKCEYVEPCTCTLGGKAQGASRVDSATATRGPLINVPPKPMVGKQQGFSSRFR